MNEGTPIAQDVKKCRGCGDPIIWIKTAKNDKFIPLNARPERRMIINADHKAESVTVWTPHWASCPQAKEFKQ
jgi:hypothetical protein